jgi:hypothetical protein
VPSEGVRARVRRARGRLSVRARRTGCMRCEGCGREGCAERAAARVLQRTCVLLNDHRAAARSARGRRRDVSQRPSRNMLVVWLRSRHLRPRGDRRLAETVAGKCTDAREKQRRRRKGLAGGRGRARAHRRRCVFVRMHARATCAIACSLAAGAGCCRALRPCVARLMSRASSRSPARRTSWETLGR